MTKKEFEELIISVGNNEISAYNALCYIDMEYLQIGDEANWIITLEDK